MSDAPHESEAETSETSETVEVTPSAERSDLPDLDTVQEKIDEAHQAEDHLVDVMPGAIDPDVDADPVAQTEGTDRS